MVYFIGAGPGDPELITIKGANLLAEADVVIYAGSLVNPAVLNYCKPSAKVYNSATMTLEEILLVIRQSVEEEKVVARLHTGDPSLYGAVQEQIEALDKEGIPYKVIPGVSSFNAAAASLPHELTAPGVTQTVILTRLEGRTPVPETEKLSSLARHRCTLVIFLSVHQIERVVEELLAGGYSKETPAVVVEKASWPEERLIKTTLAWLASEVRDAGITRTALVMVGDVFATAAEPSRLYSSTFAHSYRRPLK